MQCAQPSPLAADVKSYKDKDTELDDRFTKTRKVDNEAARPVATSPAPPKPEGEREAGPSQEKKPPASAASATWLIAPPLPVASSQASEPDNSNAKRSVLEAQLRAEMVDGAKGEACS